jgi:hypothetical protein
VRSVGDQIVTLANQIQTDNKATDIRDKNHQDRSFRWMKRGTWASIGLSALSLFISAAALYVVDKQLDTMRIEQRAWVKIAHKLQPIAENKPLIADITTINTGKTPAKRIEANFRVQKVRADRSPDLTASGINANSFIGILNPDASYPSSVPMMRDSGTILNPPLLTKSDVAEIASGESYIVVFGRLIYSDIYDTPHWINFCFWESPSRAHTTQGNAWNSTLWITTKKGERKCRKSFSHHNR